MPTLQELINKTLEDPISDSDHMMGNFIVLSSDSLEEFGKSCYMEGVNSGTPWGGSKVDHLENFLKTE